MVIKKPNGYRPKLAINLTLSLLFEGIRIFDTCGQESIALQAVLETALEANLTHDFSCRVGVHLGAERIESVY